MFSDNISNEKSAENLSITPLTEENHLKETIPTEELQDEHEQYLIKEDINESAEITEHTTPLDETKQAEPITPIPDSIAETNANKCLMTCVVM
jgi:hypothetical protein